MTRREKLDYLRWLDDHKVKPLTQRQAELLAERAARARSESYHLRREGREVDKFPSAAPSRPEPVQDPLAHLDHDQREDYLRREAVAREETREKQNFIGPAYNKGGDVFYSPGMRESVREGSHRRR